MMHWLAILVVWGYTPWVSINQAKTVGNENSFHPVSLHLQATDPIAYGDKLAIYENTTAVANVTSNDIGYTPASGTLTIVVKPKNGKAEVVDRQSIRYTPNKLYVGTDSLKYKICNSDGKCSEATLEIEVMNFDYTPQAVDDNIPMVKGKRAIVDILSNDLNLYDEPITLTITQALTQGEYTINEDKKLTITFLPYFIGQDSLKYKICDKEGDCSSATVFFNVQNEGNLNIFVPAGISPNGDGFNDYLLIPELNSYNQIQIKIINKWGQLVYENNNYENNWDGRANKGSMTGSILPVGTYYYLITVTDLPGKITGYIYIIK
jgi:gliding motility-associated-like protein